MRTGRKDIHEPPAWDDGLIRDGQCTFGDRDIWVVFVLYLDAVRSSDDDFARHAASCINT